MPQQFPYVGYHFGVFFIFPQFNFNGNFQSVKGLDFASGVAAMKEGGNNGFSHQLTDHGTFSSLTLERGFTDNRALYEWCEQRHNTLSASPCNVLVSILDRNGFPVKNWLLFHVIPKSWSGGSLNVTNNSVMVESVSFTYQNFILI